MCAALLYWWISLVIRSGDDEMVTFSRHTETILRRWETPPTADLAAKHIRHKNATVPPTGLESHHAPPLYPVGFGPRPENYRTELQKIYDTKTRQFPQRGWSPTTCHRNTRWDSVPDRRTIVLSCKKYTTQKRDSSPNGVGVPPRATAIPGGIRSPTGELSYLAATPSCRVSRITRTHDNAKHDMFAPRGGGSHRETVTRPSHRQQ